MTESEFGQYKRKFISQAGIAQSNQGLVITQPSNEANQDRRSDCASCSVGCLPSGRGSGVQRSVCCHPGADQPVKSGS